jgi:hypothetical protein
MTESIGSPERGNHEPPIKSNLGILHVEPNRLGPHGQYVRAMP